MDVLECTNCGSNDIKLLKYPEYICLHCGTKIVLTQAPTGFVDVIVLEPPIGPSKIQSIKKLRYAAGIDLKTAMDAVDRAPWRIYQHIPVVEGELIMAAIIKAGGDATLKPA